jgi:hypothetical protein
MDSPHRTFSSRLRKMADSKPPRVGVHQLLQVAPHIGQQLLAQQPFVQDRDHADGAEEDP